MNAPSTQDLIRTSLEAAFQPAQLIVRDDSHHHIGHVGAAGGGHFHVTVESAQFAGQSRISRHRQVYAVLNPLIGSKIHALAIEAIAPGESQVGRPEPSSSTT
jgi:BolA protein